MTMLSRKAQKERERVKRSNREFAEKMKNQNQVSCPSCGGTGHIFGAECEDCNSTGVVSAEITKPKRRFCDKHGGLRELSSTGYCVDCGKHIPEEVASAASDVCEDCGTKLTVVGPPINDRYCRKCRHGMLGGKPMKEEKPSVASATTADMKTYVIGKDSTGKMTLTETKDDEEKPDVILYQDDEKKHILAKLYLIETCDECEQKFWKGDNGLYYSHVDCDGIDELKNVDDWIHDGGCDGCNRIFKKLTASEKPSVADESTARALKNVHKAIVEHIHPNVEVKVENIGQEEKPEDDWVVPDALYHAINEDRNIGSQRNLKKFLSEHFIRRSDVEVRIRELWKTWDIHTIEHEAAVFKSVLRIRSRPENNFQMKFTLDMKELKVLRGLLEKSGVKKE